MESIRVRLGFTGKLVVDKIGNSGGLCYPCGSARGVDGIRGRRSRPLRRFHFKACWAREEDCRTIVSDSWESPNNLNMMVHLDRRLRNCAQKLAKWNAEVISWILHSLLRSYRIRMYSWPPNLERGKSSIVLKFDMSKAYDQVNGEIHWDIRPTRGLQHGDPLSPYLFFICTEGLSCLINDVVSHDRISSVDCKAIKRILGIYTGASVQVINFNKSALCVSKSVSHAIGARLGRIMGVWLVKCHERYLGLPSFTCRNKKQLFGNIREKVWKRVRGWNNRLFSSGEKEVLLKAVVQVIPTYAINLFQLPIGLVKDGHRLCNRFWWGSTEKDKKLH
ncbi:hypothetical protein Ddye_029646 [Dipteronia dyeriana]|uniref:Reverse transcriptase domain-containing protein n=1 Tax=Dipteronia dyeriana TaxID=168575 RepID=A0AAD9TET2_9ROSI|nr:hypothetical protein Ddye_029646 [Dipteronia dyeriana]